MSVTRRVMPTSPAVHHKQRKANYAILHSKFNNGLEAWNKRRSANPARNSKLLSGNPKLVVELNVGIEPIIFTWGNILYSRNTTSWVQWLSKDLIQLASNAIGMWGFKYNFFWVKPDFFARQEEVEARILRTFKMDKILISLVLLIIILYLPKSFSFGILILDHPSDTHWGGILIHTIVKFYDDIKLIYDHASISKHP
jgi:hypothetical protein